jgi:segregation and condensation protein B
MAGELPVRKDMHKDDIDEKKRIEAVLFASEKALSLREIAKLSGVKEKRAKRAIDSLNREYERHAFEITEAEGRYVLQLRDEFYPFVKDFVEPEIGEKLLQTLAIIASNEPIKQSTLREFVGERVYDDVRELCKRGLVKYKKENNTKILRTTPEFKKRFKLKRAEDTNI